LTLKLGSYSKRTLAIVWEINLLIFELSKQNNPNAEDYSKSAMDLCSHVENSVSVSVCLTTACCCDF